MQDQLLLEKLLLPIFQFLISHSLGTFSMYAEIPENSINKEDIGLYRDDGLGLFRNLSGTQKERKKKQIIKLFKECNLTITIDINLNIVNYLDVQLNVKDGTYKPYRTPNNDPVYINCLSNHPPNIIREIPKSKTYF